MMVALSNQNYQSFVSKNCFTRQPIFSFTSVNDVKPCFSKR